MRRLGFFHAEADVGWHSLVYHLAWMYADLGVSLIAADLSPQAGLTRMFIDDARLEELWSERPHRRTVYGAIQPVLEGTGSISEAHVEDVATGIGLLAGDPAFSASEDDLAHQWSECLKGNPSAFEVTTAIWRAIEQAARRREASIVLIDAGADLGALGRTALMVAEHVVLPLAPDLYSLQALPNLGRTLRRWRSEWTERRHRNSASDVLIPDITMLPAGYVVMQRAARLDLPMASRDRWLARIPPVYRESVLGEPASASPGSNTEDPHCLGVLKHYPSLEPLAQEARKPMFFLKPADGAGGGGHTAAVQECYVGFHDLAERIALQCGFPI